MNQHVEPPEVSAVNPADATLHVGTGVPPGPSGFNLAVTGFKEWLLDRKKWWQARSDWHQWGMIAGAAVLVAAVIITSVWLWSGTSPDNMTASKAAPVMTAESNPAEVPISAPALTKFDAEAEVNAIANGVSEGLKKPLEVYAKRINASMIAANAANAKADAIAGRVTVIEQRPPLDEKKLADKITEKVMKNIPAATISSEALDRLLAKPMS